MRGSPTRPGMLNLSLVVFTDLAHLDPIGNEDPDPIVNFSSDPDPAVANGKIVLSNRSVELLSTVVDPECLSRIRIFSIPDPGSMVKKTKNLSILTLVTVSNLWEK